MTDRYHSLAVILDHDIRNDDAESILTAIKMIKGVLKVTPHIADLDSEMAESRAVSQLTEKLWEVLYPKKEDM